MQLKELVTGDTGSLCSNNGCEVCHAIPQGKKGQCERLCGTRSHLREHLWSTVICDSVRGGMSFSIYRFDPKGDTWLITAYIPPLLLPLFSLSLSLLLARLISALPQG